METQDDFKELLALLNEHRVKYLIVGGYALAFHGAPLRIDIITSLTAVDWEQAYAGRVL